VGRISRGKMVLRKERVELSSVAHHVVEAVRPLCESSDQELTVTLPHEPVYLNASPVQWTRNVHGPDGVEAVKATTRLQPDVILLDIGLPLLNGYEAARQIREQQERPGRPLLVAVTGWGQDEDRRRTEEAGFDAHLVKPVDEAALRKLLDDLGASRQEVGSVPALQHISGSRLRSCSHESIVFGHPEAVPGPAAQAEVR
jgi:CheY-like chemotaxis protein